MGASLNKKDFSLIKKYRAPSRQPRPGYITDYFGNLINIEYHPYLSKRSGTLIGLTLSDDGILHGTLEYWGLALAVDLANGKTFTAMELGAGYGPWLSRAGILAHRKGIKKLKLIGMEADPTKFKWLKDNLKINGLTKAGSKIELHNAAISARESRLYFPELVNSSDDYGTAASKQAKSKDYRGLEYKMKKIKALPLRRLLADQERVEVAFIDIQGSEHDVIKSAIDELNNKVKVMIIGTHSRKIEGDLISFLHKQKWTLEKEEPCLFYFNNEAEELTGMTVKDGCQIWVNSPTLKN